MKRSISLLLIISVFILSSCTEPGVVDKTDTLIVLENENQALKDYISDIKTPDIEYVEVPVEVEVIKEVEVPRELTEEELEVIRNDVRKELESEYNESLKEAIDNLEEKVVVEEVSNTRIIRIPEYIEVDAGQYSDEEYSELSDKFDELCKYTSDIITSSGVIELCDD